MLINIRSTIAISLIAGYGCAQAQPIVNPNGFPSGPHYNLNIIGKKAGFNCVEPEPYWDPELERYVFGGVVFVPDYGVDTEGQILIKSGRKSPKNTDLYPVLQVPDPCSTAFDGTPAVVELPPSANGYWVYARALARPGGSATLTYNGDLLSAIDDAGKDLAYLGLVTGNAVALPNQPLVRSKGQSKALDITGLFLWSGEICDIDWNLLSETKRLVCWTDNVANPDRTTHGVIDPSDSFAPVPEGGSCTSGLLTEVPVVCSDYSTNPEWIFNIADLVASDWLVENNGTKLIQIRFYPVP